MKKYIILSALLFISGCQAEPTNNPAKDPGLTPEPVPEIIKKPDCSQYERKTDNPAINDWFEKKLKECLDK